MNFVLPKRAEVGFLSPEIAGEGQKVILSDGEQVEWTAPAPKPVMPDWSQIKSIARYFGRTGMQVWPAWLYHPTEEPRLVKNADEAAALGVCYREATQDERGRYGLKAVWDWQDDSLWRPTPHSNPKFDPAHPGPGKNYEPPKPNTVTAQNMLLEAIIPTVTAAVVTALKGGEGPKAPAHIDPKEWDEFIAFQAFKKTQEAVDVAKEAVAEGSNALSAAPLTPTGVKERAQLEAEANRKGIKIDHRWSLERLKSEVQKAA